MYWYWVQISWLNASGAESNSMHFLLSYCNLFYKTRQREQVFDFDKSRSFCKTEEFPSSRTIYWHDTIALSWSAAISNSFRTLLMSSNRLSQASKHAPIENKKQKNSSTNCNHIENSINKSFRQRVFVVKYEERQLLSILRKRKSKCISKFKEKKMNFREWTSINAWSQS